MAAQQPPVIDPVPTPPIQRGDRVTFSSRVDAFILWLVAAVLQFQALAANVYANALDAFTSAGTATTKANAADASAGAAAGSATAAAQKVTDAAGQVTLAAAQVALAATQAGNAATSATSAETSRINADKRFLGSKSTAPTVDNQGAALMAGAAYYDTSLSKFRAWSGSAWADGISAVAGVSSVNGGSGAVTLKTINGQPLLGAGDILATTMPKSSRTTNAILVAADKGALIDITSGTFTQTFTAAATLGSGWYCWLRNNGTGDITLDPNGSELIDGQTSFLMYPGESRIIQCDGAALASVVITPFTKTVSVSGAFVRPPGYGSFDVEMWSAGGGGGSGCAGPGSTAKNGGGGGGGGGYLRRAFSSAEVGVSVPVTVGSGGAGGAAVSATSGANGTQGGNSLFGSFFTIVGGGGGGGGGTSGGGAAGTSGYPLGLSGIAGITLGGVGANSNSGGGSALGAVTLSGVGGGGGGGEQANSALGHPSAGGARNVAGGGGTAGASSATPTAGGNGAAFSGGGGGGSNNTTAAATTSNGAAGGNGGTASGGGGGGSAYTGNFGGAGGNGGNGYCIIRGA